MYWYFLRFPCCNTGEAVEKFKRELRFLGSVADAELGTAVDPTAGWFVVRSPAKDVSEVRQKLRVVCISHLVDLVESLKRRADGKVLARQLALF